MPEPVGAQPIEALDLEASGCRAQLLALWRRAYQVEANLIGAHDFPPLRVSLESLVTRPGRFYGITQDGRLVGAIEVEELGPQARQIAALVVEPDCARRGIGRRLVEFVLEVEPGRIVVSTSAANAPALALYRAVGFRQTTTSVSPEGIELCSMEWVQPDAAEII